MVVFAHWKWSGFCLELIFHHSASDVLNKEKCLWKHHNWINPYKFVNTYFAHIYGNEIQSPPPYSKTINWIRALMTWGSCTRSTTYTDLDTPFLGPLWGSKVERDISYCPFTQSWLHTKLECPSITWSLCKVVKRPLHMISNEMILQ